MNLCLNCRKETSNPKFCSLSCSNKVNNKLHPKRKKTIKNSCTVCGTPLTKSGTYRCSEHSREATREKHKARTLGEFRQNELNKGHQHPSWMYCQIRSSARILFKHLKQEPCAKCGYTKHVEIAHIKDIATFPDTATIAEINSKENIVQLCPNCHWEFDNLPRDTFWTT